MNLRKIRILHVVYSFSIGGMEKGIVTLINNSSCNFEHTILCLNRSGGSEALLKRRTKIIELNKEKKTYIRFLFELSKTINYLSPDVVHTRNWGGVDGIISTIFSHCNCNIHSEHGWDINDKDGTNIKRIFIRRFLSLFVKEYISVSLHMKNWLENSVKIRGPVKLIYNGVNTEIFTPKVGCSNSSFRAELGLDDSDLLIGTVARLDLIKDQETLIGAFRLIRDIYPNCHLVIVGDGPERGNLENIAEEGIHFLGWRKDIDEILRALDIYTLPSLNEGVSNTILEAMSTGLPVVATQVGGTPELIESGVNGFLIKSGDKEALAEALCCYLSSSELRLLHGSKNRELVEKFFTVGLMTRKYEKVWRRSLL